MSGMDAMVAALRAELGRRDRAEADNAIKLDTDWAHFEDEVEVRHLVPGCEWSMRGADDEVDRWLRAHLAGCVRTEGWRLVQAHRRILDRYDEAARAVRRDNELYDLARCGALAGVLGLLADVYEVKGDGGV